MAAHRHPLQPQRAGSACRPGQNTAATYPLLSAPPILAARTFVLWVPSSLESPPPGAQFYPDGTFFWLAWPARSPSSCLFQKHAHSIASLISHPAPSDSPSYLQDTLYYHPGQTLAVTALSLAIWRHSLIRLPFCHQSTPIHSQDCMTPAADPQIAYLVSPYLA